MVFSMPNRLLWTACRRDILAAMREPTNHNALNSEVMIGRSLGYASSPSRDDPAMIQNGIPNPRMDRAAMYMPAIKHQ
jgi:hypothetical protein